MRVPIRRLSAANPLWGAPRIIGELRKIGIDVTKATIEKYMVRRRGPASPTWMTFLRTHAAEMISRDFFVVPTVKHQVLFVFLILMHHRRRVLHFHVTPNPSARWTAQQIVEAFPYVDPPRFLLRDRDHIHGPAFNQRVNALGIEQIKAAPWSPWQNPYVERLIGSIRRECLDHTIVLGERHLKRLLSDYFRYYHRWRTHQALEMDSPEGRDTHSIDRGRVAEVAEVGGLHHHYERIAV